MRGDDPTKSRPTYLGGKKYLDARKTRPPIEYFEALLRHIWNRPKLTPPPVGSPPTFEESLIIPKPPTKAEVDEVEKAAQQIVAEMDIDNQIRETERELAQLPIRVPMTYSSMRMLGDRADYISRLSVRLDRLRQRKAEIKGHNPAT